MGHSLEIDNIIATTAMEGVALDESAIDDLGKVERRERSADDIVDDRIPRLRSHTSRVSPSSSIRTSTPTMAASGTC